MSNLKYIAISIACLGLLCCSGCAGTKTGSSKGASEAVMKKYEIAQSQYQENPVASAPVPQRSEGELAPGYLIRVSSGKDPELNGRFRIAFDGKIELPYDKTVDASGLTLPQLRSKINSAYKDYFTGSADIGVEVAEKDFYVEILGLVEKPGQYLAKEDESLDSLISKAGGLQKAAGTGPARPTLARFVKMDQLGQSRLFSLSDYYAGKQEAFSWLGGDRLFFQSDRSDSDLTALVPRNQIQLLGEVKEPGEYGYLPGADFFYYLVKAKGPTDRANMDWVTILRPDGVQMASLSFSLEDEDEQPEIQGGDTVILHAENPTADQKKLGKTGIIGNIFSTLATVTLLFTAL